MSLPFVINQHVNYGNWPTSQANLWSASNGYYDRNQCIDWPLDSLDNGSPETAITSCNKLLKKHPKNNLIKVINQIHRVSILLTFRVDRLWKRLPSCACKDLRNRTSFATKSLRPNPQRKLHCWRCNKFYRALVDVSHICYMWDFFSKRK